MHTLLTLIGQEIHVHMRSIGFDILEGSPDLGRSLTCV
jgi:hypothetical protein